MDNSRNPFEFDAAPNLDPELLVDWYIEDHNFSRFIGSSRNVLINGERGSGKSMALIYNSVKYQKIISEKNKTDFPPSHIGIYIPCNTALTHKEEYRLLPKVEQAILSEHFLACGIGLQIAKEFLNISDLFSQEDNQLLIDEISFLLEPNFKLTCPFLILQRCLRDRLRKNQQSISQGDDVKMDFETSTFYTLILPIMESLKKTSVLKNSHLSLLIDDAHDLNNYQRKVLNSWLGYRDHSIFSFKVAIAGLRNYELKTAFGGTILEGHDYITINLEQTYQNNESGFGKFARDVIKRRLLNVGIQIEADAFFPQSSTQEIEIEKCNAIAREKIIASGVSPDDKKTISDYVYKYGRALYFKSRSAKANKPIYAGFDTLAHVSTGVIRNLLDPCYWMFDNIQSNKDPVEFIPSNVQSDTIHARSERLWDMVRNRLDKQVEGCGKSEAIQLGNLITAVAEYFRHRLHHHKSEPRILTFIISQYDANFQAELEPIFLIAQKAQLLYIRPGTSKDGGGKEDFYILNRMLWPQYGLDVNGQHGRASIKAIDLVNSMKGTPIPTKEISETQGNLFP